jgi:molecular chaperone GrpE (heat shock protein)
LSDSREPGTLRAAVPQSSAADARLAEIERDVRGLIRDLATAHAELASQKAEHALRTERLLLSLLEILDAFERIFASATIREEALSGAKKVWLGNFRTVYRLLVGTLREQGIEPIEVRTRQFDPLRHQAVETVPDPELPTGTIVRQEIRGYAWDGRILRKTGVAVASPAQPAASATVSGKAVDVPWEGS